MISRAIHQAQCDGVVGITSRERCARGEAFTAPEERMSLGELTAFFVLSRTGWQGRGGRIYCPSCARVLGCPVPKATTEGHA